MFESGLSSTSGSLLWMSAAVAFNRLPNVGGNWQVPSHPLAVVRDQDVQHASVEYLRMWSPKGASGCLSLSVRPHEACGPYVAPD